MARLSILVLGAGELGIAIVRSLAVHPMRNDAELTVLKRSVSPVGFEQDGVSVRAGDVVEMSGEQLASLLGEYHTVISANGMILPPETQIKLAKAAIAGGVKRYFPCTSRKTESLIEHV
jgi:saccharopine dehydrogenase-like NADP-dependent oxidoreductase